MVIDRSLQLINKNLSFTTKYQVKESRSQQPPSVLCVKIFVHSQRNNLQQLQLPPNKRRAIFPASKHDVIPLNRPLCSDCCRCCSLRSHRQADLSQFLVCGVYLLRPHETSWIRLSSSLNILSLQLWYLPYDFGC